LTPHWEDWTRLLAWQLDQFKGEGQGTDQAVYIATNAHWEPTTVELPEGDWYRIVDTSLPSGQDIVDDDAAVQVGRTLKLEARSTIVLLGK